MTDVNPSETIDTGRDNAATAAVGIAMLAIVVAITGSASLMMSFHGLRDLVQRVEDVQGWLSNVGPVGIDGLQLASLVAIIITVNAPLRVRVYLWTVFFASIGLSVAGNCVDAAARHAGVAGVVLSGVWPALLAGATHVAVVAVRWFLDARRAATAVATPNLAAVGQELGIDEDDTDVESVDKPSPTEAQLIAWAKARYKTARSSAKVGTAMRAKGWSVSDKQVERWTKDLRTIPTDVPAPEPA